MVKLASRNGLVNLVSGPITLSDEKVFQYFHVFFPLGKHILGLWTHFLLELRIN